MADKDTIFQAFKSQYDAMTPEERFKYLDSVGLKYKKKTKQINKRRRTTKPLYKELISAGESKVFLVDTPTITEFPYRAVACQPKGRDFTVNYKPKMTVAPAEANQRIVCEVIKRKKSK